MASSPPYTPQQVDDYLAHIGLARRALADAPGPLAALTRLQQHHLARVPFDNIALHYSPTRLLSLDPEDLFHKIVGHSRGGYCMEVNALFGNMLRCLGYRVVSVGARVRHQNWYLLALPRSFALGGSLC